MESLYLNLYDKYSTLKTSKDVEWSEANKDQEVKFVKFVSDSETLIEHLTNENKSLRENVDELRSEVCSLSAKYQQGEELQERLEEEKQKNEKLSAEIEQLRRIQHEGIFRGNTSERQEDYHVNDNQCSPPVSPMRMTRKRTRLFAATESAINSPSVSPRVDLSTGGELSSVHPKRRDSDKHSLLPECCRINIDNGGHCTCLFQNLTECLVDMKVSIVQSEQRCIRVIHQSCGYSFNLTWTNKATLDEGEVSYNVSSLGTLAKVAPRWMREEIEFSTSMLPIFFERVKHIIKPL